MITTHATIMVLACLLSLSGCSTLRDFASSKQTISPPTKTTLDGVIEVREQALLAGENLTYSDAAAIYCMLGGVRIEGPADIKRSVMRGADGSMSMQLETSNSGWMQALFGGMWDGIAAVGKGITSIAAGANPF